MKACLLTAVAFGSGGACVAWSGGPVFITLLCFIFAATCVAMAVDEWEGC